MKRLVKVLLFVAVISLTLATVAQQPSNPADNGAQGKNI